jgi:hypothetical protein
MIGAGQLQHPGIRSPATRRQNPVAQAKVWHEASKNHHEVCMQITPDKLFKLDLNEADKAMKALLSKMEDLQRHHEANEAIRRMKAIAEYQRSEVTGS